MHGLKTTAAFIGMLLTLAGAESSKLAQTSRTVESVRTELMRLPYYGVFDFLAFGYDKGTVTLTGYAFHAPLKNDAERAAKRAPSVDAVINQIEVLPVSQFDEDLRWQIYYKIYRDPFLSRYAPGGEFLWGHRHAFGAGARSFRDWRFPGMEPAGDYPIHIIVKAGRVTLLGVVDSESDKTVAGLRAREVPGSFALENELMIDNDTKATRQ